MTQITLNEETRQQLQTLLNAITTALTAEDWGEVCAASQTAVRIAMEIFDVNIWNYATSKWNSLSAAIRSALQGDTGNVEIDPAKIMQAA